MLVDLFRTLDGWIVSENAAATSQGLAHHQPCTIRVFDQVALLEAGVELTLAATQDVDVYADWAWPIQKKLEELLAARGKFLDPLAHEAWMPKETEYRTVYAGSHITGAIAEPDFVLLSKALKAPAKNAPLMTEYLAAGASERFLQLAKVYDVDLEQFL